MKIHRFFSIKCISLLLMLSLLTAFVFVSGASETEEGAALNSGYEDGLEYQTAKARARIATRGEMYDMEIEYSDGFFERDPANYYHDLARASFGMTISAFRTGMDEGAPLDANIKSFYEQIGFENFESTWYDQDPTESSISTAIASKKTGDSTVIAFVCCGEGYGMEWLSNLTVGEDREHKGFSEAAYICEERLLEYIEKYNITGDMKLWTSGFSRASAVGNMFAGRMMQKDIFSGIYGYFYATPNNTKDPVAYPNIFNIVGQNDPVPMVPLAEWGYGRNGIDLFTPAQEANTSFIYSAMMADEVSRELTGMAFRNNPEESRQLRTVLEYLAAIFPTAKDYAETLQPQLCHVWVQHSSNDILLVLSEALKNIDSFDSDRQLALDSLISYLDNVIFKYISGNEIQVADGSWNNDVNLGYNVAMEHLPEVYASWLFSEDDPEWLFADSTETLRLVIEGEFDLEVWDADGMVQEITSRNEETVFEPGTAERQETGDLIYLYTSNNNGMAVVNIPGDHDYEIKLKSLKDNTAVVFENRYAYGKTSDNLNKFRVFSADKGEVITLRGFRKSEELEAFRENGEKIGGIKQTVPEGINSLAILEELKPDSFSIRNVLAVAFFMLLLPLVFLLAAFFIFLAGRKKKRGKTAVTVCFACMSIVYAVGAVIFSIMLPNIKIASTALALLSGFIMLINIARYRSGKLVLMSLIPMAAAFLNYFVFLRKNRIILHTAVEVLVLAAGIILTVLAGKKWKSGKRKQA